MTESVWKKCERCDQRFPPIRLYTCGPGGRWLYCAECFAAASRPQSELERKGLVNHEPNPYEGQTRTGVFTNCGYHGTASGWIVRDGTYWIATFRGQQEADEYVAQRNGSPVRTTSEGPLRGEP